jgi:hypothetical protein
MILKERAGVALYRDRRRTGSSREMGEGCVVPTVKEMMLFIVGTEEYG